MSLNDQIKGLPNPPVATPDEIFERCTQYALMQLPGQPFGIHMGTSYLISDLQMSLRAALARLALARELIEQGTPHHPDCERVFCEASSCTCGRDALLAALERQP